MKSNLVVYGFLFFFSSCDPFALKPLNVKTVKSGNLVVRWFITSDISTVHNHVEMQTNDGWKQIMEADGNGDRIYDVLIDKDTVIVRANKGILIYELRSIYRGKHVRVDTSTPDSLLHRQF